MQKETIDCLHMLMKFEKQFTNKGNSFAGGVALFTSKAEQELSMQLFRSAAVLLLLLNLSVGFFTFIIQDRKLRKELTTH